MSTSYLLCFAGSSRSFIMVKVEILCLVISRTPRLEPVLYRFPLADVMKVKSARRTERML